MAEVRAPPGLRRGMWAWKFAVVTSSEGGGAKLLHSALKAGVTDLYLYVPSHAYEASSADLRDFIARASRLAIRTWALDGARAYFSDADGPREFHANIDRAIAHNARATSPSQRFYGFQADNEPADRDGHTAFTNGGPDSKLTPSQAARRQALMHDWLTIHAAARAALHRHHLRFSAAMPHWLGHYEGEPITVRYPSPSDAPAQVMHHMMDLVDDYVIMSYNTDPAVVVHLVQDALRHADSLPPERRPAVQAAVETERGIGPRVSYGDAEGQNSRDLVLGHVATMTQELALRFASFSGVSIHHFCAWEALEQ